VGATARHFGLDPKNDVDLIFAGSTSARYAALIAGGVEGAILAVPQTFDAQEQGYTNLGFVGAYLGEVPTNVWHVNEKWTKEHESEVLAFAVANNRGAQFILDPKNRTAASEILAKATNIKLDLALKTYDLCIEARAFVPDGSISMSGLEQVRRLLDESGDLQKPLKPIETYFDGRYIAAAKTKK
jgi:NitT/TauT family transport system substrate-binding protein